MTVIVVSYNTRAPLHQCLEALDGQGVSQVIVIDNASTDGSVEMLREVMPKQFPGSVTLASSRNLGFGRANNFGLIHAEGDLVLYLNSDAYAHPGAISQLASNFADPGVIAAGGKLLNPDGSLQESVAGRLSLGAVFLEQFFLDKIAAKIGRSYWRTRRLSQTTPSEVEQVMGACLMVRRDADPRFDERFFLYCEDTELCHRLRQKGKIIYDPQAVFTHELGSSSVSGRWRSVARYNLGKELYFRIHHGPVAQSICVILNRIGAILRLSFGALFYAVSQGARDKFHTFFKVLKSTRKDVIPDDFKSP